MIESVGNRILKLFLYLAFLVAPTLLVLIPVLFKIDEALLFINTDIYTQTIVASLALTAAYCCYYLRFRFIITFPIVLFFAFSYYQGMKFFTKNEFDAYYYTIKYLHIGTLFIGGWLMGYGLARFRYFPHIVSITALLMSVLAVSDYNTDINLTDSLDQLFFIILYSFYTYFIRESLENVDTVRWRTFGNLTLRAGIFVGLVFLLFQASIYFLKGEIKQADHAIGQAQKEDKENQDPDEENMLSKNSQQQFDINQTAQLKSRFGSSKELLFAAYVDNFFPNRPDIPNPLYFTCYHLTKYDTKNERFYRDPNVPSNDLFSPNPSSIPKYFTSFDTSVIGKSKGKLFYKIVESEIYLANLSPQTFTAPSTAFSCQPITVDPDYKEQYKFAYKTNSYVSLLNSAYFIYNAAASEDKTIKKFQEERINELKKVKHYKKVDTAFYNYYTEIPKGPIFDSIKALGKQVTQGAKTPIEKVLKVRDFFTKKDALGKPLFKYTLYPGSPKDPNIPNATMLSHFLFKNRKGYCTYFAASTLFMLRAAGVPVRMTTGFMIVDRSDKNKGWYFIYGDQAHAWVQVYFPEYGWLDFDTTIGNDEAQESPQPDGTPPMKPQKAIFAGVGQVVEVDTAKQFCTLSLKEIQLSDKDVKATTETTITVDLKEATITKGNFNKKIRDILPGDSVTVISYEESLKRIQKPNPGESLQRIKERLPNPVPINELNIHEVPVKPKEEVTAPAPDENYLPWWALLLITLGGVVAFLFLFLLTFARLVYAYYNYKLKTAQTVDARAYWLFKTSDFIYHQFDLKRNHLTPLAHAREIIDPALQTQYGAFVQVFHKIKYDKLPATADDLAVIQHYQLTFEQALFGKYTFMQRNNKFMNVINTVKYILH